MATAVGARPFHPLDVLLEETIELYDKIEDLESGFRCLASATRSLVEEKEEAHEFGNLCGAENANAFLEHRIKRKLHEDIPANRRVLPVLTDKVGKMLQKMAFVVSHMERMNVNAIVLEKSSSDLEKELKVKRFETQLPPVQLTS